MAKYTLQQELAALETLKDWIEQSEDKSGVVAVIMTNTLNELRPHEVADLLMQFLCEHLEGVHDQAIG
jgi:oligoribonuclease (3'-5' exoribonuclease)